MGESSSLYHPWLFKLTKSKVEITSKIARRQKMSGVRGVSNLIYFTEIRKPGWINS